MAFTKAGFQGTVTETQEAGRFARAAPRFLVDGTSHLAVTAVGGQNRTVQVAAGTCQCCGVTAAEAATTQVVFDANTTTGTRLDLLVLRFTWSGLGSSTVLAVLKGTNGSPNPPTPTRTPGVLYEAPLAVVSVPQGQGVFTAGNIKDIRPYGGLAGGRVRVAQSSYYTVVDLPYGGELLTEDTGNAYRFTGTWTQITAATNPWTNFDPVLRYTGGGGGTVGLGSGAVRRGRYKVVDSILTAQIEVRWGTGGYSGGSGDITVDLPAGKAPDTWANDTWHHAHLYTTSQALMDWPAQVLILQGQTVGRIFTPVSPTDTRLAPYRITAAGGGGPGSGTPTISGGYPEGGILVATLVYGVA